MFQRSTLVSVSSEYFCNQVGFFPSECVELIRNGDQPSLVKMKAMKPGKQECCSIFTIISIRILMIEQTILRVENMDHA